MAEEMFDPEKMQSIVDKLKAEGRMPTPEMLHKAMEKGRARWQAARVCESLREFPTVSDN